MLFRSDTHLQCKVWPSRRIISVRSTSVGVHGAALALKVEVRFPERSNGQAFVASYKLLDQFRDADQSLRNREKEKDYPALEHIVLDVGREALRENGDWLSMHRERKLRLDDLLG